MLSPKYGIFRCVSGIFYPKIIFALNRQLYQYIIRAKQKLTGQQWVQILAGLITYLLLAIYCREQHNEKVSIKRVRELRIKIQNEIRTAGNDIVGSNFNNHGISKSYANT